MNRGSSKKRAGGRRHQPARLASFGALNSKHTSFSRGDTDQHTANNHWSTGRLVDWDGNGRASRCVVFGGEFQSN